MFAGFSALEIDTGEAVIHLRKGGDGPALLLLHGFPETHLMWHAVAERLAADFTVVAADLRGYGDSGTPASAADHAPYSKRAMARDMARVMEQLGFRAFGVAGHDRGGRVAYRLAIDFPARVERLAVLDIVPIIEAFNRADKRFALSYWPFSLLAQPSPFPETAILSHPSLYVSYALDSWSASAGVDAFPGQVRAAYVRALSDPATVHAICEEYRAAATIDCEHDAADLAATNADAGEQPIKYPALVLWARGGPLDEWYDHDPLAIWRRWAGDVRGSALDCGHFLPEEVPEQTYRALHAFLSERRAGKAST
jgi:haloacetate dehalogenase